MNLLNTQLTTSGFCLCVRPQSHCNFKNYFSKKHTSPKKLLKHFRVLKLRKKKKDLTCGFLFKFSTNSILRDCIIVSLKNIYKIISLKNYNFSNTETFIKASDL